MKAYAHASALAEEARSRLITENVPMARRMALRLARHTSLARQPEDVVSTAMVGLIEAANRYEPSHGEPFAAFAQQRIRGAVLDELRRRDALPRRLRKKVKQAGLVAKKLEAETGKVPEDEDVARALGISGEDYQEILEAATQISFLDLNGEDDLEGRLRVEDPAGTPEDRASHNQDKSRLVAALKQLPERDAQILQLYYVEEFTYSEIAGLLGVSSPRVCQLHGRALARLRAEFDGGTP